MNNGGSYQRGDQSLTFSRTCKRLSRTSLYTTIEFLSSRTHTEMSLQTSITALFNFSTSILLIITNCFTHEKLKQKRCAQKQ